MAVTNLLNMFGIKHVKDNRKRDKHACTENWATIVKDGSFTTKRVNELLDMTKSKRITHEITTKQILLYVNKLLKPTEVSIKITQRTSIHDFTPI